MTLFIVHYKNKRKRIYAEDLEEAENIANNRIKTWTDIIISDKRRAKCDEQYGQDSRLHS